MIQRIKILNMDDKLSTACPTDMIASKDNDKHISNKKYIVSDVDEELLILIQFKQIISLKSIKLFAPNDIDIDEVEDTSPPKQIHIYKLRRSNITFDDIDSLIPDKSIECSPTRLEQGQLIKLQSNSKIKVIFNKIQSLCIYIKSNQNDTEKTYIHSIALNGQNSNPKIHITTQTKNTTDTVKNRHFCCLTSPRQNK